MGAMLQHARPAATATGRAYSAGGAFGITWGTYVEMLRKRALVIGLPFTLMSPETWPLVNLMARASSMELLPAPAGMHEIEKGRSSALKIPAFKFEEGEQGRPGCRGFVKVSSVG